MLECGFGICRPTLDILREGIHTYTHSMWMLNLLVDITRVASYPILRSYWSRISAAISYLSTRVMIVIADGNCSRHLNCPPEFLAGWEKRPVYLTPMAYWWYSAISAVARRLRPSEMSAVQLLHLQCELSLESVLRRRRRQLWPQDLVTDIGGQPYFPLSTWGTENFGYQNWRLFAC